MFKHNLYLYLGSFIGGVAIRSFFNFGFSFIILFFLLSSFFLLDYFLRRYRILLILSLVLIFFGLGLLRFDLSDSDFLSLSNSIGKGVELEGVIVEEPKYGENSTTLIFELNKEKILIITENFSPLVYGDTISVKGLLKKPENFISDNNKEFDYINYLAKDKIYYQMLFPKITFIDKSGGNFIKSKLFSLKNVLASKIENIIPSPEGEYLNGLLFGVKESLGKKLEKQFRDTGLIHVVVLSGYNVTLVAEAIMRSLSFLPIALKTSLGSLGIVFFAIMTGAGATTVVPQYSFLYTQKYL
jgi:competence protein ComEC